MGRVCYYDQGAPDGGFQSAAGLWITYDILLLDPRQPGPKTLAMSHIPLDFDDENTPLKRFGDESAEYDGIGIIAMDDLTVKLTPDLDTSVAYKFELFLYSDGAETAMVPAKLDNYGGGFSALDDFTGDEPGEHTSIDTETSASTSSSGFYAITLLYDGSGTDLFPPYISYQTAVFANPNGGDFFIHTMPLNSIPGDQRIIPRTYKVPKRSKIVGSHSLFHREEVDAGATPSSGECRCPILRCVCHLKRRCRADEKAVPIRDQVCVAFDLMADAYLKHADSASKFVLETMADHIGVCGESHPKLKMVLKAHKPRPEGKVETKLQVEVDSDEEYDKVVRAAAVKRSQRKVDPPPPPPTPPRPPTPPFRPVQTSTFHLAKFPEIKPPKVSLLHPDGCDCFHCETLSGNAGSDTNSDDVGHRAWKIIGRRDIPSVPLGLANVGVLSVGTDMDDMAAHAYVTHTDRTKPPIVNPTGLTVAGSVIREIYAARRAALWKHDKYAPIAVEYPDGKVIFAHLSEELPAWCQGRYEQSGWTWQLIDDMFRFSITGEKPMLERPRDKEIGSAHGSKTETDDLMAAQECPNNALCPLLGHYHRKKSSNMKKPDDEKKAKERKKSSPKFELCPRATTLECGDGYHWHDLAQAASEPLSAKQYAALASMVNKDFQNRRDEIDLKVAKSEPKVGAIVEAKAVSKDSSLCADGGPADEIKSINFYDEWLKEVCANCKAPDQKTAECCFCGKPMPFFKPKVLVLPPGVHDSKHDGDDGKEVKEHKLIEPDSPSERFKKVKFADELPWCNGGVKRFDQALPKLDVGLRSARVLEDFKRQTEALSKLAPPPVQPALHVPLAIPVKKVQFPEWSYKLLGPLFYPKSVRDDPKPPDDGKGNPKPPDGGGGPVGGGGSPSGSRPPPKPPPDDDDDSDEVELKEKSPDEQLDAEMDGVAATLMQRKDLDCEADQNVYINKIFNRMRHSPLAAKFGALLGRKAQAKVAAAEIDTMSRRIEAAHKRIQSDYSEHWSESALDALLGRGSKSPWHSFSGFHAAIYGEHPWFTPECFIVGSTPMQRLQSVEKRPAYSCPSRSWLHWPFKCTLGVMRILICAHFEELFKWILTLKMPVTLDEMPIVNFPFKVNMKGYGFINPIIDPKLLPGYKKMTGYFQEPFQTRAVDLPRMENGWISQKHEEPSNPWEITQTVKGYYRKPFQPLAVDLPREENGWVSGKYEETHTWPNYDLIKQAAFVHVAACCMFAAFDSFMAESRRSKWIWRRFAVRLGHGVVSHLLLSTLDPWNRLLTHTAHNVFMYMMDMDLQLNVVNSVCVSEQTHVRTRTQLDYREQRNATQDAKEEPCDVTFGARALWSVEGIYSDVYRNCVHNEIISLEGRVGKLLPQHGRKSEVLAEWVMLTYEMADYMTLKIRRPTHPMEFDDWVQTFPPHKQRDLKKLKDDGYELKDPKKAKSFIKQELVMRDELALDKHKDPRMIQGCPPELTVAVGPYLRRLAKKFRSAFKPSKHNMQGSVKAGDHIIYTCGMNAVDIGQAYSDCLNTIESMCGAGEWVVVVEDDESRFDEHITEGPFHFVDQFYKNLLPARIRLHLKRTARSRGRTSLGTKYTVPFTMQSGWPDTSLADSVLNAVMKMKIHGIGRNWLSIICGDDSVTVTTNKELERLGGAKAIESCYARYGMECEVVVRDDPLKTEFCSSRFYPCGETYILMPKTGKFFGRLGWDRVDRQRKSQLAWGRGVMEVIRIYGQIDPILNDLYETLYPQLGYGLVTRTYEMQNKYTYTPPSGVVPTTHWSDVYTFYSEHYGLSAADVDELRREVRSMKIDTPSAGRLMQHICRVDCS
jgi:hypothetical protein